jgi:hypothetical protein
MLKKIRIELTRDSVCMADDMEDHTKIMEIDPQKISQKTIMHLAKKYLPSIGGYGHTWDCYFDGAKIAVIEGNCNKITPTSSVRSFTNGSKIYFKYHSAT